MYKKDIIESIEGILTAHYDGQVTLRSNIRSLRKAQLETLLQLALDSNFAEFNKQVRQAVARSQYRTFTIDYYTCDISRFYTLPEKPEKLKWQDWLFIAVAIFFIFSVVYGSLFPIPPDCIEAGVALLCP